MTLARARGAPDGLQLEPRDGLERQLDRCATIAVEQCPLWALERPATATFEAQVTAHVGPRGSAATAHEGDRESDG